MMMRILAALAAMALASICPAKAQDFPSRAMTMIIPFAAGGPTDILGRLVAGRMSELLGQTVIVENVNGAGGMTGSERVANAAPDGYSFVLATVGTHAQGQTLYKHPLYDAVADFTPVILIAQIPLVLRPARTCRSAISRNSSPTPRRTRRRCNSARPVPALRRISAAC